MILIDLLSDNETVLKVRKNLLTLSLLLLFFASLQFLSNELNFFGLKVGVSHDKLIFIFRLVTAFVLIRFMLIIVTDLIGLSYNFLEQFDKKWEKETLSEFPQEPRPDEDDGYFLEDYEEKFAQERGKRERKRTSVLGVHQGSKIALNFVFDFVVPLLLGNV